MRSFLKNVKKNIRRRAHAVAHVADKVGEAVSDIVETAGNAMGDKIKDAGKWSEDHLGAPGTLINEGLKWIGESVAAGATLCGAGFKAPTSLFGHSISGMILMAGGTGTGDSDMIKAGFIDIVESVVGSFLVLAGFAIHIFNASIWGVRTRPLTNEERKLLSNVFRKSIAYYNVRIAPERGGAFSGFYDLTASSGRPMTLGNIIYMNGDKISDPTLVHECTHVWQYQQDGPRYAANARWAELEKGETRAYNWRREIRAGRDHWPEMNNEAQAEFVEDVWRYGDVIASGSKPVHFVRQYNGTFFDDMKKGEEPRVRFRTGPDWDDNFTDHTALAN